MKAITKQTEKTMRKWYRDLERASIARNYSKQRELVWLEETERIAGNWPWDAECFDLDFINDKDDLLHRAYMATSMTA